ncbi:MAG: hypothetical protein V3S92_01755 [Alphaproteobacteria bacterium]
MRGTIRFMAEFTTGLMVIAGAMGFLVLLLGCLVAIEASTSGTPTASGVNALTDADLWMRKAQIWLGLTPARLLGSYAISLGAKVSAVALAAAIPLDIMYSLRTVAEHRRR